MDHSTSAVPARPAATPFSDIDRCIAELRQGAQRLSVCSLHQRIVQTTACIEKVGRVANEWVELACQAKQIPPTSSARAEEVLVGPASALRYLQLVVETLRNLQDERPPRLPGNPRRLQGQLRVPTFPTNHLYDALVFQPLTAETWLQPEVTVERMYGDNIDRLTRQVPVTDRVTLVLGAGNVSAIPLTDTLTRIIQDDSAVLLKMNPVNDYLGSCFARALEPFIDAGVLRIIYGGGSEGEYAVRHPGIDSVHITGSTDTHDLIVWGTDTQRSPVASTRDVPVINKPITSELGNVTPWIIVPGDYSEAQLRAQAENVAASIANNASFNCVATKMLITWKHWPARERFLDLVESILRQTPARYAYYPGAAERFAEFSGQAVPVDAAGRLPWTLKRDVDPVFDSLMFRHESFVCVAGETVLDSASPDEFLDDVVEFANDELWGTLAIALTVPDSLRKKQPDRLDSVVSRLRYGTVGVNQWPGVAYALMSTPWGAFPGSSLRDVQSGIGFVHNTFLLDRPEKTVLRSPLTMIPKPVWFSTHRCPEAVAWKLCQLYQSPSLWKIPGLLSRALRG